MANPYPVAIQDERGIVHVQGDANFTDPDNLPGGGLPTGWTQDESDPANVSTNGANLNLNVPEGSAGSLVTGGGQVQTNGGAVQTGTGNVETGGGNVLLTGGSINTDGGDILLNGGDIGLTDAVWSDSGLNTFGGTLTTMGGTGAGTIRAKGALGVNGAVPNTPVLPAIPTPQDIADALVALGVCTQAP